MIARRRTARSERIGRHASWRPTPLDEPRRAPGRASTSRRTGRSRARHTSAMRRPSRSTVRIAEEQAWRIAGRLSAERALDRPNGWTSRIPTAGSGCDSRLSWPDEVPGRLLAVGPSLEVLDPPDVRERVDRDRGPDRRALPRTARRSMPGRWGRADGPRGRRRPAAVDAWSAPGGGDGGRLRRDLSGSWSAWMVRASSIRSMPAVCRCTCQFSSCIRRAEKPLDRPRRPQTSRRSAVGIRLFFSCSSVVSSSDHRPARIAGSAAARHPAGGSTRRRSKVSLSGGPFRCWSHRRRRSRSPPLGVRHESTWTSVHARRAGIARSPVHSVRWTVRSQARSSGPAALSDFARPSSGSVASRTPLDELFTVPGTGIARRPRPDHRPDPGRRRRDRRGRRRRGSSSRRPGSASRAVVLGPDGGEPARRPGRSALIPFIGDMFDFVFRSNAREPRPVPPSRPRPGRLDTRQQAFFVGLVLLLLGVIWLTLMAVGAVWQLPATTTL